jgi:hypothetical protein
MGLFNKKEDVPSIPPAPTLPPLPKSQKQEKKDLPELPSFPANPKNEDINQEMVKSAVADSPAPEENEVSVDIPEGLHVKEEEKEESIMVPPKPSPNESIPQLPKKTLEINPQATSHKPQAREVEPIFVRIDKFQSAQKNFEKIKDKVKEIESVLKKIKDVKSQEETELKSWTEDVTKIKSRLAEVDSDIFDQI